MSSRPLSTSAGVPVIESMMRWTAGRTCCGAGRRRGRRVRAGGPDQVEQMRPLGVIELQRVRDAVDDALRDAGGVAALEPGVVLRRDPGEDGDLLAAQARDPPVLSPVHGQPGLRGTDPGPPRAQERPDLAAERPAARSLVPAMSATVREVPPGWGSLRVPLSSGSATSPRWLVVWTVPPRKARGAARQPERSSPT